MHKMALMQAETRDLRGANEALSKRRRAKEKRLRQGGSLTVQGGQDLQAQKDVEMQIREETQAGSGRKPRTETRARRCGRCGGLAIMPAPVKELQNCLGKTIPSSINDLGSF